MHTPFLGSVHGVIAMAVIELRHCQHHRYERIRLLCEDGAVYELREIQVEHGTNSLTLKAAAWTLKQERLGRWKMGHWRQVKPAATPAAVSPNEPKGRGVKAG